MGLDVGGVVSVGGMVVGAAISSPVGGPSGGAMVGIEVSSDDGTSVTVLFPLNSTVGA